MLDLGKGLFDGVEIGAVGGQEEKAGTGCPDGLADGFAFVAAEIVEDDGVAGRQFRNKDLLDMGLSGFPCAGGGLNITPPWP